MILAATHLQKRQHPFVAPKEGMIQNRLCRRSPLWILANHCGDQLFGQDFATLRLAGSKDFQIVFVRQDVCLSLNRLAERMFAVGQDVIIDATQRENVNRGGLKGVFMDE